MTSDASVRIVDQGVPRADIRLDEAAGEVERFAADELARYLHLLTGARVPLAPVGSPTVTPVAISLHVTALPGLPPDSFRVTVGHDRIELAGTTARGVLYAVYSLLEQVGCAWVYPGAAEEIVPRLATVAVPVGIREERPTVVDRGLALYELYAPTIDLGRSMVDWMAKNRFNLLLTSEDRLDDVHTQCMHWPQVKEALLPELRKRGLRLELSEHTTHQFLPPELFAAHPDWFALIGGQRQCRQMCFANPEAVAYFAGRLVEYARTHPEADILGTWPLDGAGYCECPACNQTDAPFRAIRNVAAAVGAARPELTIEYLAYTEQTMPVPRTVGPLPNMSALVCDRLDAVAADWVAFMRDARGACYFEYQLADNYRWKANVWLRPRFGPVVARRVAALGYHGVVSLFLPIRNWWRSAFNTWFFARALWEPQLDVDAALARYCRLYYGPQADLARAILEVMFTEVQSDDLLRAYHWAAEGAPAAAPPTAVLPKLERAGATAQRLLTAALAAAVDPTVRARFQRLQSYVEYFLLYYAARSRDGQPIPLLEQALPTSLLAYAAAHPLDHDGVCMNPEFIAWRFDKFVRWGG